MSLYSTYNPVYFEFYKREMFNSTKVLMQTWIDRGRKGFIEYTIIPFRRPNRQVTLAVYVFYASHRFPVEHVQTPGGQTTFEAWKLSPSLWVFSF